jgi:hypothetical protein
MGVMGHAHVKSSKRDWVVRPKTNPRLLLTADC